MYHTIQAHYEAKIVDSTPLQQFQGRYRRLRRTGFLLTSHVTAEINHITYLILITLPDPLKEGYDKTYTEFQAVV